MSTPSTKPKRGRPRSEHPEKVKSENGRFRFTPAAKAAILTRFGSVQVFIDHCIKEHNLEGL